MSDINNSEQIKSTQESSFYGIITEDVLSSKNINAESKLLFIKLTMYARNSGYAWPSNKTLSNYFNVDESTIQRWLKSLKDNGFIQVILEKRGMITDRKIYINANSKNIISDRKNEVLDTSKMRCSTPQNCGTNTIRRENIDKEESIREPKKQKDSPKKDSIKKDSIPSFLEKKKKEFPIVVDSDDMIELYSLESEYIYYFTGSQIRIWLKKYGDTMVLKTLKYFLQQKLTKILNPGAWMEEAFKQNYAKNNETIMNNKENAEIFREEKKLKNMKINTRYIVNTDNGKELYFYLPEETFCERMNEIFIQEL